MPPTRRNHDGRRIDNLVAKASTPPPLHACTLFPRHTICRLHSMFEHGKLRSGAPSRSRAGPLWGLLQAAVPKRMFSHFYFLGVATSVLVLIDVLLYGGSLFTASIQVGHGSFSLECF